MKNVWALSAISAALMFFAACDDSSSATHNDDPLSSGTKAWSSSSDDDDKSVYDAENNTLTDLRDGKTYRTTTISIPEKDYSEVWMAQNLNYETVNSHCYDDVASNCAKYGRLYAWAAAVGKSESECGYDQSCDFGTGDVQGVCPNGWHLPSKDEFEALINAAGGSSAAGKALKSVDGWDDDEYTVPNDDAYSFAALPAGDYDHGDFRNRGYLAYFWSSTQYNEGNEYKYNEDNAYDMNLYYDDDYAYLGSDYKGFGISVRCLKD